MGRGYFFVFKVEGGRVISGQSWGEPKVVVHLDAKGFVKGVRKRGMAVVKVSEVRGVKRGAGQKGWREW